MGGICKRLSPDCILLNLQETGKEAVIRRLVESLGGVHAIADVQAVVNDVMEREKLASTCVGLGCAVPHAHSEALETTMLAAATLNPPVDMDAPDGEPVSLVFLIAGSKNGAGLHLRLLSKLARLLHNEEFREELRQAAEPKDFYDSVCRRDD